MPKEFRSLSHQTRELFFSSWSESPSGACWQTSGRQLCSFLLRSGFCLATILSRLDRWSAVGIVAFLEASPLSTEDRWGSERLTIRARGHLLDEGSPPWLLSLDGMEESCWLRTSSPQTYALRRSCLRSRQLRLTSGTLCRKVCLSKSCPINKIDQRCIPFSRRKVSRMKI